MSIVNGTPLSMQLSCYFMMPFSENETIANDNGTHRRIGACCSHTATGKLYGSHHP